MSSYRGAGAAWDGGPPGAEAEYAGQRAPAPTYEHPAPPSAMPTTDPWTGVSYSQYGAAPSYEYQAYGAATAGFGYSYDSSYYQRPNGAYYGKYPDPRAYPPPQHSQYEYPRRAPEKSRSPNDLQRYDRRRSYRSKSRTVSPYNRRERESSYEQRRHRRSRSKSSKRKKYSSSDRSSSRSRSYSRSSLKRDKKKRDTSSESWASDRSYRKRSSKNRGHDSSPPPRHSSSSRGRTPSVARSPSKSPTQKKSKDVKPHSSKDKRHKKVTTPPPPPQKRKESAKSPKKSKKTDRSTLTPPRVYKLENRRSGSPAGSRERSLTPPKSYARRVLSTSKSRSRSPSPRHSKRKRSRSGSSGPSRSSFSRSRSSTPARRSRSKSKHKKKRKSRSKSRSKRRSVSKNRSVSRRRSKSRGKGKNSISPRGSKSRSRSRSSRSRSRSGTPSDDARRGQFTVADRKRFWKLHRNRQEEREKEAKTPPKELKPPPGVVEDIYDVIEYRDPPEVEGPNFADLLPPPDQLIQASSSKSKPLPIPIKNDGSFLEMFKKMQEVTKKVEETDKKPEIKKPALPFIGKRRGGRVLKTGLVKKAKAIDEQTADNTPKDAWSLYMQEVKKYRETSCEEERKTRPLVK